VIFYLKLIKIHNNSSLFGSIFRNIVFGTEIIAFKILITINKIYGGIIFSIIKPAPVIASTLLC